MRALTIGLLLACAAATAAAWDISGANQTALWLRTQQGSGLSYRDRFDLRAAGALPGGLSAELGLRYLADQEQWDDATILHGIAKRWAAVRRKEVSARIGTYHAALGRGLLLNCVDESRVGIDRDLDGVLVDAAWGGLLEGRLLSGQARQNSRPIDTSRTYAGGQLRVTPLPFLAVGAGYLRANAGGRLSDPSFSEPVEEGFGGNLGLALGPVDLYGEYAARHAYGYLDPSLGWMGMDDPKGGGGYGSASLALAGLGLVADAKWYRRMNGAVNAPPACNREGRLISNGEDEYGYGVDGTAAPLEGLELHGNYSWARDSAGLRRWEDNFAELRWEALRTVVLTAEARARTEQWLQPDIPLKKYKGATLGATWRYRPGRSLTLSCGADRYDNVYLPGPLKYREYHAEAGLSPVPWASLSLAADLADHRLGEYGDQRSWGRAAVRIEPARNQTINLSLGKSKGGLVCANGFCRYEPPFKGFKATWEWRF